MVAVAPERLLLLFFSKALFRFFCLDRRLRAFRNCVGVSVVVVVFAAATTFFDGGKPSDDDAVVPNFRFLFWLESLFSVEDIFAFAAWRVDANGTRNHLVCVCVQFCFGRSVLSSRRCCRLWRATNLSTYTGHKVSPSNLL